MVLDPEANHIEHFEAATKTEQAWRGGIERVLTPVGRGQINAGAEDAAMPEILVIEPGMQ